MGFILCAKRFKNCLAGLAGTRKVGKTIFLKQLAESNKGIFITAEEYMLCITNYDIIVNSIIFEKKLL